MSYAIKNLRDVEDSAPKFGYGDIQEARFPRGDLGARDTGLAYHVLKPGRRQGFAHRHDEAEEIYVVLRGSGRVKLADEVAAVRELDAIRVAPEVVRACEAGEAGLELLAFGPRHEGDGVLVREDVWGD